MIFCVTYRCGFREKPSSLKSVSRELYEVLVHWIDVDVSTIEINRHRSDCGQFDYLYIIVETQGPNQVEISEIENAIKLEHNLGKTNAEPISVERFKSIEEAYVWLRSVRSDTLYYHFEDYRFEIYNPRTSE